MHSGPCFIRFAAQTTESNGWNIVVSELLYDPAVLAM